MLPSAPAPLSLQLLSVSAFQRFSFPAFPQTSTASPGTRANSFTLWVTSTSPAASACAAISRSSGPIGVPDRSSAARIVPYCRAASHPNGSTLGEVQVPLLAGRGLPALGHEILAEPSQRIKQHVPPRALRKQHHRRPQPRDELPETLKS